MKTCPTQPWLEDIYCTCKVKQSFTLESWIFRGNLVALTDSELIVIRYTIINYNCCFFLVFGKMGKIELKNFLNLSWKI